MQIYNLSYPFVGKKTSEYIFALGYFDGVHRGHQEVLRRAVQRAQRKECKAGLLTFHPHPSQVIGRYPIQKYITPLSEKMIQFRQHGIDTVYIMEFTNEFSWISKDDFVNEVLLSLGAVGVVTGFNFTFGKGAEGQAKDLQELGCDRFDVDIVDPVEDVGGVISSTRVRCALREGRVEEVHSILGRPYEIIGNVVTGDQQGRLMGFPTANLSLSASFIVPCHGVYVVRVLMEDGRKVIGMMNIGVRPTIPQASPEERLEIHLLDWYQDIYGERLHIEFLHYLRKERRFMSLEELKIQIQQDIEETHSWLSLFAMTR